MSFKYIRLLISFLAFLVMPLPAMALECPKAENPTVSVTPVEGEIEMIRSKSVRDLTHMKHGSTSKDGAHVNGLGGGRIGLEGRAHFRITHSENQACIQLSKIDAEFFAYPDIHIARNLPKNSCEYAAVLEHEMKHVNALMDFHEEYTGIFKTELKLIAKRIKPKGPVPLSHAENIQEQMNKKIGRYINLFNDRILPTLQRRQAAIDTEEEYERVHAQCKNWHRYNR